MRKILITGGAGFIGSNFTQFWHAKSPNDHLVVLDALTYAGNVSSINKLIEQDQITFVRGNISNRDLMMQIFTEHSIDTVVHFAAESHVDRSIAAPDDFMQTNIIGTHVLLSAALEAWRGQLTNKRFHHISTDEVYGDLGPADPAFTETTPYAPRSPYAASKASSDHLVRSYNITYGFPSTITNCSNNYGPLQFPEKLIPLMIANALDGKPLPVYGAGRNVRDWLYVEDHCRAIAAVLEHGKVGETYNVGGDNELTNIDLVRSICHLIDDKITLNPELKIQFPRCAIANGQTSESLIQFVKDRPGHDRRYAINGTKILSELGFQPRADFTSGLNRTVDWYITHEQWWRDVQSGEHLRWVEQHYGE